jgi:anti-sigma factor RsiW
MAYVDDELDEEGRRHVEDLLARSAEAREIAELMRSSSTLLKSAFLDDPDRNTVTPPSIKRNHLCRPMTGVSATRTRVRQKA